MTKLPLLCAALLSAIPFASAAIPAGGALPNPNVGIGSGPTTPFVLERPAPAGSVKSTHIDLPDITLNPNGNWSIYIATIAPTGDHDAGTIFSIGDRSDTLFANRGHLALTWVAQWANPFSTGGFTNSFVVTGRDDEGTLVASRDAKSGSSTAKFYNITIGSVIKPLVSQGGLDTNRAIGLVIQRRGGVVEFWSVDHAGPRIMDSGSVSSTFKGITNKPFRLGCAALVNQPTTSPFTTWKYAMQGVVVYNGGCLTPVQMKRLFSGAHAADVLQLDAARDDRYYPGTLTNGLLDELVGGKTGTPVATATAAASLLPTTISDDVIVDMDGFGQVFPRDPPPATTTKARFWGTRIGNSTDIRMRVVKWTAPFPVTNSADIVVDWVTVATNVANGQAWIGDVPGVPDGFADYDGEVSWRDGEGNWTTGRRLLRKWTVGVVASLGGQSIIQRFHDDNGPDRSFDPQVLGYMRGFYYMSQGSALLQENGEVQGWQSFPTTGNKRTFAWGTKRMEERLALLADCPVGVGNFAVGGSPLSSFGANSDRWARWKHFIQRNRPQIGVWGNGQGDVTSTTEQRHAALDELLARYDEAVQTAPGGPWKYMFYIFPINGDWNDAGNRDRVRSQDMTWAASRAAQGKPVGLLGIVVDNTTLDGTHLTKNDAGHGLLASRMAQTFAHAVGAVSNSGVGPEVDTVNSSWKVINGVTTVNLVIKPNGGSALVTAGGGAPSGFRIKVDGGSLSVPASTAIIDPTHVRITSNTPATSSVTITYLAGCPGPSKTTTTLAAATTKAEAGTDNAIYDNRGDITGLVPGFPMNPITAEHPFVVPQQQSPDATISDVSIAEPKAGATSSAMFTITLSAATDSEVTLDYATSNGTALAGTHFVGTNGTVVFPAGTTSQTVPVTVLGEVLRQPSAVFSLTLGNPSNAVITDASGVATINAYDSDQDGLPNAWENEHALDPSDAGTAATDDDGDGMNALHEYRAGTNPRDNSDYFHVSSIQVSGDDIVVTFKSVDGKAYRVEISNDLSALSWSTLASVTGTGTEIQVTDPGAAGTYPKRFYRVVSP
jgi:hypothetical protein